MSSNFLPRLLEFALLAVSVCTVGWVISYAPYGFDITDEGYYLNIIRYPENAKYSVTLFGHVFQPIFRLLDYQVVDLRRFSVVALVVSGLLLSWAVVSSAGHSLVVKKLLPLMCGHAILILCIFSYLSMMTPNYNTLNLIGFTFVASGVLLATNLSKENRSIYLTLTLSLAIALGGLLSFLAKPPSAVMLGILVLCVFAFYGRRLKIEVFTSAFIFMFGIVFCALYVDGSLIDFYYRYLDGIENSSILLGEKKAFFSGLPSFGLKWRALTEMRWEIAPVFFCVISLFLFSSSRAVFSAALLFTVICLLAYCLVLTGAINNPTSGLDAQKRDWLNFLLAVSPVLLIARLLLFSSSRTLFSYSYPVVFFLLLLPFAYSLGTGTSFARVLSYAGMFWASAALYLSLCAYRGHKHSITAYFISLVCAMGILLDGRFDSGYRQPLGDLKENVIEIGEGPLVGVRVKSDIWRYILAARTIALQNSVESGLSVIDLTGESPGTIYAIGADSAGGPWLLGNYPGSEDVATKLLDDAGAEKLALSWILVEFDGRRSISTSVMPGLADGQFDSFYELVGKFQVPQGLGDRTESKMQGLYRPLFVSKGSDK